MRIEDVFSNEYRDKLEIGFVANLLFEETADALTLLISNGKHRFMGEVDCWGACGGISDKIVDRILNDSNTLTESELLDLAKQLQKDNPAKKRKGAKRV
jgi:hypothetical protein